MVGHARGPETDNTKKHLTPPPSPLPQQRNKQSPESFSKEKKKREYIRQTCEKLQCLYENPISNNFRNTAVLKKYQL